MAKVLARRLRGVLASVIGNDQTCGVAGRACGLNLSMVWNVIAWVEDRGLPLAVLSLDQEKAFNRVSHEFLFLVLRRMGFGPGFIGWLALLCRGTRSRVCVNGVFSRFFL